MWVFSCFRAYWEFLIHRQKLQGPIPGTKAVQRVPCKSVTGRHVSDALCSRNMFEGELRQFGTFSDVIS